MKKLANDAAHKANGQKYGHNGQSGGKYRQTNFTRAIHRGLKNAFAHLHVANNIFAHHNGIVNQQSHTQTECHHGDHVDAETPAGS